MTPPNAFLVITDLDATLLDHRYDWSAAREALEALRAHDCPLVLNSSKTIAEMRALAARLDTRAPLVAENGGLLALPKSFPAGENEDDYDIQIQGLSRAFLIEKAHELRSQAAFRFEGFADWSVGQLMAHTGLEEEDAARAMEREASEPILWQDSEEAFLDFKQELALNGIRILKGGRFFHLMGQEDKADGLRAVSQLYHTHFPERSWTTVALGDSANDLEMLEAADIAVVIPHAHGNRLHPDNQNVIYAPATGPSGWNQVILKLIKQASSS
ncbi:MAG: HAD-IIB family hydrolase [Verrucomicrobiales bacterium]